MVCLTTGFIRTCNYSVPMDQFQLIFGWNDIQLNKMWWNHRFIDKKCLIYIKIFHIHSACVELIVLHNQPKYRLIPWLKDFENCYDLMNWNWLWSYVLLSNGLFFLDSKFGFTFFLRTLSTTFLFLLWCCDAIRK